MYPDGCERRPASCDEVSDPIARIQALLGELDPSALVVGFVTVVEWLEENGDKGPFLASYLTVTRATS